MRTPSSHHRRAGFTLVEVLIASVLFCLLVATFGRSLAGLAAERAALQTSAGLQDMGARATGMVYADLRQSGFVAANGVNYPYLFEDGNAEVPFAAHFHVPAAKQAEAADADFGPNREVVFCRPADLDGNDVPDVDGAGELAWSADEVSYVVVTEAGVNYLQRRLNGGEARTVASHVERIAFDDATSSGFEVPLGALRVRIWFRRNDDTGLQHRYFIETTMKLRNG